MTIKQYISSQNFTMEMIFQQMPSLFMPDSGATLQQLHACSNLSSCRLKHVSTN
jgi:hypothetical protein